MMIKIRYLFQLREVTKLKEEGLEVPDQCTIEEALRTLTAKYGEALFKYMFDKAGSFIPRARVFLNGRDIRFLDGFKTALKPEDAISLIPAAR